MQRFNKNAYAAYADGRAHRSPVLKNTLAAFTVGGGICLFGELLLELYQALGLEEKAAALTVTVTIIFLAACLTVIGVFDRIARFAGAGTVLPVCGFANAIVSSAMDSKSEGYVMGVGAKMFTVAGPVIVYGIAAGVVTGIVEWILSLI